MRQTLQRVTRPVRAVARFFEEDVPAVMLVLIVVALSIEVVARYVFDSPTRLAAELSMLAFVWLIYLGAAGAARKRTHIAVDVVTDRLPPRVQAITEVVAQLVVLFVLAFLVVVGWNFFQSGRFVALPVMGISNRYSILPIVISAGLMILYSLAAIWSTIAGAVTGSDAPRRPDTHDGTTTTHGSPEA